MNEKYSNFTSKKVDSKIQQEMSWQSLYGRTENDTW
jgi:hypothetical protein